jgi:NAD(P)-dependent dehydrogenase (short-subunit alcohol dehydrogenase family)
MERVMASVLITGGHGGIGLAAAKYIAGVAGRDLVLAGRSLAPMGDAAAALQQASGVKVTPLEMDLASLGSVRAGASRLRTLIDEGTVAPLEAIVCNAGARFNTVGYTVDGFERTFATNCLGHFLLIHLLLDRLAADGRVVFTASGTHDPATPDGRLVGRALEPDAQRLALDGKAGAPSSTGQLYSTSKLCNILNAYELHRRLRANGSAVASIAFDPGSTLGTGFLRNMPAIVQWLGRTPLVPWVSRRMGVTIGSFGFSGECLGRIAADPAYQSASGKYLQSNDGSLVERRSSKASYDVAAGAKLWHDMVRIADIGEGEIPSLLEPHRPPSRG